MKQRNPSSRIIHFELPIVGDTMDWRIEQGKRRGYKIYDGNDVASLQIQKKTLVENWRDAQKL